MGIIRRVTPEENIVIIHLRRSNNIEIIYGETPDKISTIFTVEYPIKYRDNSP
jgi:hypothetical protein